MIVTSDFARAAETAAAVAAAVRKPVSVSPKLRERFFGELELGPDSRYAEVWAFDKDSADHTEFGVESISAVRSRATELVHELDAMHDGATIVLSAHGDTLQILQTAFLDIPVTSHRTVPHLKNCDLRWM